MKIRAIDLNDFVFGCKHVRWREVLALPRIGIYAHPENDQVLSNLILVCQKFDQVREILGNEPLIVTSGYRPKYYNDKIGGAASSQHMDGAAIDFQHKTKTADDCRALLLPHLDSLKIRVEDLPGSDWVHIDVKLTSGKRFFRP